jgi:hypothetical protein
MKRRADLAAVALLAAVVAVVFWPVLCGRATLVPTDLLHQLVLPFSAGVRVPVVRNHYTFDVLRQFYPAYQFFQQSVQAGEWPIWNPHILGGHPIFASSMYSFANPFNVLFCCLPLSAAFDWRIILQFFAAMCAMYVLLRHWQLRIAASLLGAVAYGLNSQFLFNYWYGGFQTFVWVPVAVLFLERAWAGRWANALWAGLFLGLAFLAGNLQSAGLATGLVVLYAGCSARFLPAAGVAGRTVLALGIAGLVATVQWLPFLELLRETGGIAGRAGSFSDGLKAIPFTLSFLLPGLWGSTESFDLLKVAHATAGDFQASIGMAALLPALLAVAAWREPRVKVLAGCAFVILAALLLVPPVRHYFYYRGLCALVFCLAPLAALGVDSVPVTSRRLFWSLGGLLALIACGLLLVPVVRPSLWEPSLRYVTQHATESAFALEPAWLEQRLSDFWDHFRLTNPVFWVPLTIGGATLALLRCRQRGLVTAALIIFTGLDLGLLARRTVPMVDLERYPLYLVPPVLRQLQGTDARLAVNAPAGRWLVPDNLLMVYGLSSIGGYESLAPGRPLSPSNATHVLTQSAAGLDLQTNPAAIPRAYFVGEPTSVHLTVSSPNRVEIVVTNRQPGEVVLTDTYYPGWEVLVNGAPRSIRRTDSGHRAVVLETGANHIVFRYRPASVRIGALVSSISFLAALGLALLWRRRGGP